MGDVFSLILPVCGKSGPSLTHCISVFCWIHCNQSGGSAGLPVIESVVEFVTAALVFRLSGIAGYEVIDDTVVNSIGSWC